MIICKVLSIRMIICKKPVHSDDHLQLSFVVCCFSLFVLLWKQVKQVIKVNQVNQITQVNRINQVNQLYWMNQVNRMNMVNQVQKKNIASDRGEGEEGGVKYQG